MKLGLINHVDIHPFFPLDWRDLADCPHIPFQCFSTLTSGNEGFSMSPSWAISFSDNCVHFHTLNRSLVLTTRRSVKYRWTQIPACPWIPHGWALFRGTWIARGVRIREGLLQIHSLGRFQVTFGV
jgi:hypothetical protein